MVSCHSSCANCPSMYSDNCTSCNANAKFINMSLASTTYPTDYEFSSNDWRSYTPDY